MQKLNKNEKGFALLFAVVLSAILLAIALGVSNIAYREAAFTTSAKDSNDAFYAADTAAECALFYDNSAMSQNAFGGTLTTVHCNNVSANVTGNPIYTFTVSSLGVNGSQIACAVVTVNKSDTTNGTVKVTSTGYSNGGGSTQNQCIPTTNAVQRVVEINY